MTTAACRGFVYATAVMGVTGARDADQRPGRPARRAHPRGRPTCRSASGSASRNGDQAAEVAAYADGVIVGSAFVRRAARRPTTAPPASTALTALTEDLADGVRRG